MRFVLLSVLIIAAWGVHADDPFPYECKVLPVSDGAVMLPKETGSLSMIHNTSEVDVWITHPISDPSAIAGWSSRLQAGRWSAFASADSPFELSCIESKPGHEQQVPCSGVLTVCRWLNVARTDKRSPPYWVGENMPLPELLGHLAQRGFKLPEPSRR